MIFEENIMKIYSGKTGKLNESSNPRRNKGHFINPLGKLMLSNRNIMPVINASDICHF